MRGLIFTEFISLVEEKFGLRMADELLSQPGLTDGGAYTSVGSYSHREMLTLVVGLAERTGLPVPDLCKVFGEWLFPKLAANFDFAVKPYANAFDFLRSLDGVIHVEVQAVSRGAVAACARDPRGRARTGDGVSIRAAVRRRGGGPVARLPGVVR